MVNDARGNGQKKKVYKGVMNSHTQIIIPDKMWLPDETITFNSIFSDKQI